MAIRRIARPAPTPPLAMRRLGLGQPGAASFAKALAQAQAAARPSGQAVLTAGAKYLGTPYALGGGREGKAARTIDCSAFVARAYADATGGRVRLTPYTDAMAGETVAISAAEARPGDLVFYRGSDPDQPGTTYPHVALYAGNGRVLDASSAAGQVAYRPLSIGPSYTPEFRRIKGQ